MADGTKIPVKTAAQPPGTPAEGGDAKPAQFNPATDGGPGGRVAIGYDGTTVQQGAGPSVDPRTIAGTLDQARAGALGELLGNAPGGAAPGQAGGPTVRVVGADAVPMDPYGRPGDPTTASAALDQALGFGTPPMGTPAGTEGASGEGQVPEAGQPPAPSSDTPGVATQPGGGPIAPGQSPETGNIPLPPDLGGTVTPVPDGTGQLPEDGAPTIISTPQPTPPVGPQRATPALDAMSNQAQQAGVAPELIAAAVREAVQATMQAQQAAQAPDPIDAELAGLEPGDPRRDVLLLTKQNQQLAMAVDDLRAGQESATRTDANEQWQRQIMSSFERFAASDEFLSAHPSAKPLIQTASVALGVMMSGQKDPRTGQPVMVQDVAPFAQDFSQQVKKLVAEQYQRGYSDALTRLATGKAQSLESAGRVGPVGGGISTEAPQPSMTTAGLPQPASLLAPNSSSQQGALAHLSHLGGPPGQ